jgi:hypothetical protein
VRAAEFGPVAAFVPQQQRSPGSIQVPRLLFDAFMCRWFVNVPLLLGIDVVRM